MFLLFVLAAAGLLLLVVAADHLVAGASRVAARLRVTPIVVGVVIIGLGTSAPEFLVAGLAAARGEVALALASLVGSNIINVTLVLGVAALVAPIAIASTTVKREAPMSVVAVTLFAVAVVVGLGMIAGVLLALATVLALWLLVRLARAAERAAERAAGAVPAEAVDEPVRRSVAERVRRPGRPVVEAVRVVLGLAGTIAGAQLLVVNAAEIAVRLGVSAEVIGFTLVAIGTSLPELVTAVQAQRRGEADLLVGNLLGSNLFNSLAGGAIVALSAGGDPQFRLLPGLLAVMVGISVLAWILLWKGYRASRKDAVLLLVVYLACLPLLW